MAAWKKSAAIILISGLAMTATPALASGDVQVASKPLVGQEQTKQVQKALKRLGFASVRVDGQNSQEFKNVLCSWREATGRKVTRKQLMPTEVEAILSMKTLPRPSKTLVVGLNVNKRCQSMAIVTKSKAKGRAYERIFRVSTGVAGYDTSAGSHVIQRRIDGLHNSSSYPSASGWNMYRPAYFTSWGEAFHGSPSDSSVSWAPSSHGCVRMLQKDIDYLWRTGANSVGAKVYVYGSWQG